MRRGAPACLAGVLALALVSCGGGGSPGGGGTPTPAASPAPTPTTGGRLFADPAQRSLTVGDVQSIIAQAVGEAQKRGLPATIAVVDRVGNVLGVFAMTNSPANTRISRRTIAGLAAAGSEVGLQGVQVPTTAAAIAKAITGAYLSSSGNAFSTRTASQIVQEHFPPAASTAGLESGPLFGVQFSQLPCSDLSARMSDGMIGPQRSPLGLAADPGGFPLYKDGVVVGGIGVAGDGTYGFDPDTIDRDRDDEEFAALAGTQGFTPLRSIEADRIPVDGTSLRYRDVEASELGPLQGSFGAVNGPAGALVPVFGYSTGAIRAGVAYGTDASGIRRSTAGEFANRDAYVLVDAGGAPRFPIRAGTDAASVANPLTAAEVRAVLEEAFTVLGRARAQIRRPLDSRMQATISLVDTHGAVLGIVRSPDGPIFGTDVSLQKARTAAFVSNVMAASQLQSGGAAIARYVQRTRDVLGDPDALTGQFAFADRSGGNLARPYFPDGEVGPLAGPLSVERPGQFSPFMTGLQTDLIVPNLVQHLGFVTSGGANPDTPRGCTQLPDAPGGGKRLANGMQIFPGSVPIYRGDELVGGIGVSGDGIDQDDMVSFLGLHNAGQRVGGIGNARVEIRADRIVVDLGGRTVRLRYVNCPFAPFLDDPAQNVCEGL
ncbi:heme-binding protein [Erythrobacter sp.]|uniref:heme-binding protein n=1 Tax=Erythrobacter sp. TaxID=1042 RepID=UPI001B001CAA|nr:heme-binding protein [Erythrobacter sp.]MBO6525508.1 heme-binding protein [Erythrobacter sp.]MBO6529819.1 heme-binding protein [Erythrobacter sp.]